MVASRHVVRRGADAAFVKPGGWAAGATGYWRWSIVGEDDGAAHTGFGICELEPDGRMPMHLHSFEESFHVLDGTAVVQTAEASVVLGPGDYGVIPVGVPHTWSNEGDATVRWAEMQGPQPRKRFGEDTFVMPAPPAAAPVAARPARSKDTQLRQHHPRSHGCDQAEPALAACVREHAHRPAGL